MNNEKAKEEISKVIIKYREIEKIVYELKARLDNGASDYEIQSKGIEAMARISTIVLMEELK